MDYIETERARLYCGDCFQVIGGLQDREVDGVIIDQRRDVLHHAERRYL